jgi:hypothetical protein
LLYNDRLRRQVIFFFVAFLVYNLNLRPIPAGDSTPAALLPFAILGDHSIAFDRFEHWYESQHVNAAWFRQGVDGHWYSAYPILLPLLLTPLYVPLGIFLDLPHMPVERVVLLARVIEKLSASLIAALSVAAFMVLAEKLTNRRTAVVLTVVYAFGSQTWSTSSQALWQHGSSELAIVLGLLCFLWALEQPDRYWPAVLTGVCAGCSVAFRPTNAVFLLVLAGYVLLSGWSPARKGVFALGALPLPTAYLICNLWMYGHLFSFGEAESGFARGALHRGLPGLLISPSRGLLVFSPVFLFAAIGVYLWFRDGRTWYPKIYGTCLLVTAVHLVVISRWRGWSGGYNYGPRLLTDIVPLLVIMIIPALRLLQQSRSWRLAFASALLASISVQAIGVFFYPHGRWDALPQPLSKQRERVWDWKDNQILRSVRAGPVLEPYQLAYSFLKNPGESAEERLRDKRVKLW